MKTKIIFSERAAVFLELTLSLPLIILSITLLAWLGQMLNARSSLTAAVRDSVRLAATRVNRKMDATGFTTPEEFSVSTINAVTEFRQSADPMNTAILPLLASEEFRPNFNNVLDTEYKNYTLGTVYQHTIYTTLNDERVPAELTYALIYVYQYLQLNNSGAIRFPCDPDTDNGTGCVHCKFLNPNNFDTITPVDTIPLLGNQLSWPDENGNIILHTFEEIDRKAAKRMIMTCSYRPDSMLLNTISAFLTYISGNTELARRFTISSTSGIDLYGGA